MNATGHEQCKWHSKGITLTSHRTHCIHTSMTEHHLHCSWPVHTSMNLGEEEVLIRCFWLLRSTAFTMIWRQSNVTSVIINCIYLWCRLRLTSHECHSWMYESRRSYIGSSKEIASECKYYKITTLNCRQTKVHEHANTLIIIHCDKMQ